MLKKIAIAAIASGVLAKGLSLLLQKIQTYADERRQAEQKPEVQRWEDEGGLVPVAVAATQSEG